MGIKKIILGEPMPDKNDPKYKQKYERDVEAGRKFANASGLGWLSGRITIFAKNHKEAFLFITFGTVILLFSLNIIGMVMSYRASHSISRHKVFRELIQLCAVKLLQRLQILYVMAILVFTVNKIIDYATI